MRLSAARGMFNARYQRHFVARRPLVLDEPHSITYQLEGLMRDPGLYSERQSRVRGRMRLDAVQKRAD